MFTVNIIFFSHGKCQHPFPMHIRVCRSFQHRYSKEYIHNLPLQCPQLLHLAVYKTTLSFINLLSLIVVCLALIKSALYMTTPSSICMIRSASLARSRSCVTTISVCPKRLAQSRKSFIVSFPVFLSRFPVGSSANMICGFAIIDLAIATRSCCPPDSSPDIFKFICYSKQSCDLLQKLFIRLFSIQFKRHKYII